MDVNMAQLGSITLFLAFFTTLYVVFAYVVGIATRNVRLVASARGGVGGVALLVSLASAVLVYLLLVGDFKVLYVAQYTNRALPTLYKVSAFWAGQAGSLLLWALVLFLYAFVVAYFHRGEGRDMVPYASAILMFIGLFFLYLLTFVSSPFETLDFTPADGQGLNPLLQNPGMLIHPVTTYLGYVGFAVPFAFAVSALLLRKSGVIWIKLTRRWTLITWMFLSIGIIYGAQWAYVELGWGGYWAWDPVENASLMPWLTGTAFLHSVMIQEKKGMLKVWNVSLVMMTFLLTIFGTFLTRSGILSSVHAFGESTLGMYFLGFLALMTLGSLYVLFNRMEVLAQENEFESALSKESSFLLNNLLLVGAAFAVFWGTVFPLISETLRGVEVTVSAPFFNRVLVPIGILLVVLTGICPLIAWRRSSFENLRRNFLYPLGVMLVVMAGLAFYLRDNLNLGALLAYGSSTFVIATIVLDVLRALRVRQRVTGEGLVVALFRMLTRNRRRYGGYLVHLGVVIMIIGIAGSSIYDVEVTKTVRVGEVIEIQGYTLEYTGIDLEQRPPALQNVVANVVVFKDGQRLGIVRPEKAFHPNSEGPVTEVAILSSLAHDVYVILAGWDLDRGVATFKVKVNPLVAWLWFGAYLLVAGTVFAVWPEGRRLAADREVNLAIGRGSG